MFSSQCRRACHVIILFSFSSSTKLLKVPIYGSKCTILSGSNEKPEVNMVIFVMFRGPMWLQIRTFVCFRDLRFDVLLLVLNRDRYFHLLWRRFGMSNPAKRGHAPPSGETPGYNPAIKTSYCTSGNIEGKPWALTIWMEFSVIPGRIQIERFISVESFLKKGNTFRGFPFSRFLTEFPEISVPFVHSYSARLFTVILLRKNAKDLKDGGRFPKCLSLLCASLLVGSVGGRFRTQLQPPGGRGTPANFG